MTPRPPLLALLLPGLAALALAAPASGLAAEPGAPTSASSPTQGPEAPATPTPGPTSQSTAPAGPSGPVLVTPQVQSQNAQRSTSGSPRHSQAKQSGGAGGGAPVEPSGGSSAPPPAGASAAVSLGLPAPAPLAIASPFAGVPSFFIESFRVPPFLLPIYQTAGLAYGIPWQVLAAINEVETDYGRDLSVSSAGAEGWMQFLPSSWAQYGVDANHGGFEDPYNPADAIFAAAAYLRAAGGDTNIRAAIYAYNHSQAYVSSVMLRAQLLSGTPQQLLGAIGGLSAARFPVHAPAHFSDGFQNLPASGSRPASALVGTTIYTQVGAPVIAVQAGEVTRIGDSPELGRFVSLRDAYGDTYTYAQLGSVAALYPVLRPLNAAKPRPEASAPAPAPHSAATAGTQPSTPGAAVPGLALGASGGLQQPPVAPAASPPTGQPPAPSARPPAAVRVFREGANEVYLHPLRPGVQVLAGTVLGHVGSVSAPGTGTFSAAHIFFQIRPSGTGAPLIDPKPILDGWVALENASVFRVHGTIRGLLNAREASKRRQQSARQRSRAGSAFRALRSPSFSPTLSPNQWIALIARLGQIAYPNVAVGTSAAAIPDQPGASGANERQAGGNG